MPKTAGQWAGLLVTTIIVLGRDLDVVYAMPLGIMAGGMAALFVMLAEAREKARVKV